MIFTRLSISILNILYKYYKNIIKNIKYNININLHIIKLVDFM